MGRIKKKVRVKEQTRPRPRALHSSLSRLSLLSVFPCSLTHCQSMGAVVPMGSLAYGRRTGLCLPLENTRRGKRQIEEKTRWTTCSAVDVFLSAFVSLLLSFAAFLFSLLSSSFSSPLCGSIPYRLVLPVCTVCCVVLVKRETADRSVSQLYARGRGTNGTNGVCSLVLFLFLALPPLSPRLFFPACCLFYTTISMLPLSYLLSHENRERRRKTQVACSSVFLLLLSHFLLCSFLVFVSTRVVCLLACSLLAPFSVWSRAPVSPRSRFFFSFTVKLIRFLSPQGTSGEATNFMSRGRAIRKLQLSLADFR